MATQVSALPASPSNVEVNTSLVIAVCVLGTLVGVGLLLGVVVVVLFRCECCASSPRAWTRAAGRRDRKSRAEVELENFAGGVGNFITDSMLPGNRTGASENLGLRSPNHCRIPALRIPEDFSPSPPFPPEAEQIQQPKAVRERLPSPNKSRRLTVLNTLAPNTMDGTVKHYGNSSGENTLRGNRVPTIEFKKDYSRIPCGRKKTREHSRILPETKEKQVNEKGADGYPVSDCEADDQYKGFGHSYYKPGGFSSYIPQNIFDTQRSRYDVRGSNRRNSYSVYSRIPSCSESDDDSPSHEVNVDSKKRPREVRACEVDLRTNSNVPSKNRKVPPKNHSSQCSQRAVVDAESLPLASSSRNTSMDGSKSTSQRYDSLDRKPHQHSLHSHRPHPPEMRRALERRPPNLVPHQNSGSVRKKSKGNVPHLEYEGRRAVQEAPSDQPIITTEGRHEIGRLTSTSRAFAQFAQPQEDRVGGQQSYILANALVTEGANIWSESAPHTDSRSPSFRQNSVVTSNPGQTGVYQGGCPALNDPSSITLPSQHSSRSAGGMSLLYHASPHSSSQSLRPPSKVMEESSSFGESRSVHMSVALTPLEFRKQIISSEKQAFDPDCSAALEPGVRQEGVQQIINYSLREVEKQEVSKVSNQDDEKDFTGQVLPSRPRSTSSSSCSPPPPVGPVALTSNSHGNTTKAHNVKEVSSLLDSRDIMDPTTASMSWDHLTPDPSPVFNTGLDGNHESHYTPKCIKVKPRQSQDSPGSVALSDVYSSFVDTFSRRYELRPFKKLSSSSDSKIEINTYLPVVLPAEMSEEARMFRKRESLRKQAKKLNCASLENTRGRQNLRIRPSNIVSRFNESEEVYHMLEFKQEGSFSDSVFPLKRLLSSTGNGVQKEDSASGSAPAFFKEKERRDSRSSVVR